MSVDAGPFSLGPRGGSGPAVLCLHGLSGTPYEVRQPAERLAEGGFACLGPLLPGHGRTPEDLALVPRSRWLDAVLAAWDQLASTHSRVYVVGLSMGGVLALALCARRPVAGALVMAAPLDLGALVRVLVPPISRVLGFVPSRSDIRDPEALARHPGYDRMPLRAVAQLIRLGREVESDLERVEAPLRLIYSRRDRTVPVANAERILARVHSSRSDLHLLEESGHVLPVDLEREQVSQLTLDFFASLEDKPAIDGPE